MVPVPDSVRDVTENPDPTDHPSTDQNPDQNPDQNLVAAGTSMPEGQPQPPSERVSPLVFLAIEQALEFATEAPESVVPFLLGYIDEEQKGMWKLPGVDEDRMRAQIVQLEPRPEMAVSVFDARLEVSGEPHDAFVLEAFDNAEPHSVTVIQLYTPAGEGAEAEAVGAPQVFSNGENVLRA